MNNLKSMIPFEAFGIVGPPKITALGHDRIAFRDGPMIAVIDGKLVKVDKFLSPKVDILGITGQASLGEIMVLEAKLSEASPEFIKASKIKWVVTDSAGKEKPVFNEGSKAIIGTGSKPGLLSIRVKLTLTYGIDGSDVKLVCEKKEDVKVGDDIPGPGPGPNPDPDDTLDGVAKQVATWAVALVKSDIRAKSAKPLAESFKSISNTIGQGELTSLRAVLLQSKASNNDAVMAAGVDPREWDAWGSSLQDMLYTKYTNNELSKVGDIKKLWWDISHGLYNAK